MTQFVDQTAGHPLPTHWRRDWRSLNGTWEFGFIDATIGTEAPLYDPSGMNLRIEVPFSHESSRSGLGILEHHDGMRYRKTFDLTEEECMNGILLHFGAVDYLCHVWINGQHVVMHKGGYTHFKIRIAPYIHPGSNEILLVSIDDRSRQKPRGKQFWEEVPRGCWYTPNSGIWRDVWLEFTGRACIERIRATPDIDRNQAILDIVTDRIEGEVELEVSTHGASVWKGYARCIDGHARAVVDFEDKDFLGFESLWTPEIPNLFEVKARLLVDGNCEDEVGSYFGMRKIHAEAGQIFLNNHPYYQKLVLNQGYWPESLMTPPSLDSLREDIEAIKGMGFNGVRMHQKIEDPRFYYWADRIGLLVWGEMPSAYRFGNRSMEAIRIELGEVVEQLFNHPSLIVWVPLNESWGVRNIVQDPQQQDFARSLYYMLRSADPTRMVDTNDGWEQVEESDLCGIHDYTVHHDGVAAKYADLDRILAGSVQGRRLYAFGHRYAGQPVIISEYGGISLKGYDGWGYQETAQDTAEFIERFEGLTKGFRSLKDVQGFCYTQFADVMQETNGLLTADRKPKVDLALIRRILEA